MSRSRQTILFFCVGVIAFSALTWWAAGRHYLPGEDRLLAAIVSWRQPFLTLPVQLISALGSMNVLLPLWGVMMVVLTFKRQGLALLTFLPLPLGYPLYAAFKSLVARPAPASGQFPWIHDLSLGYTVEGMLRQQLQVLPPQGVTVPVVSQPVTSQAVTQVMESGYPSGHALMAVLFYVSLAWLLCKYLPTRTLRTASVIFFGLLALLVGIARVYMAVHFPSDVLGAWLLAILFLLGIHSLAPGAQCFVQQLWHRTDSSA